MKTSKKIISLLLSAAIIMSAMVITAVSAGLPQQTAQRYILIIRFLIGKMFIFMPMVQKKMPNGRVS